LTAGCYVAGRIALSRITHETQVAVDVFTVEAVTNASECCVKMKDVITIFSWWAGGKPYVIPLSRKRTIQRTSSTRLKIMPV